MLKERIRLALDTVVPNEHLKMKLIHHGYLNLNSLERPQLSTRQELETALLDNGCTPNDYKKIITFGVYK